MTGLASVILSGAKNLNSCRVLARKVQTDPLPVAGGWGKTICFDRLLFFADHRRGGIEPRGLFGGSSGFRVGNRVVFFLPRTRRPCWRRVGSRRTVCMGSCSS
jgi:hypothetical protein